ncbi:ASCH domain-containing protein [Erwinia sp. JH02]|uniref:ASCH domain-containing protein n=1 Tax=Erwinia sp. JH02 TaxID=2733394 RepID=UPI0014880136|nr:ASCH domain-containing protein [Erwinia sp. JH02]NNS08755.1 ASCH domain-containing protein [Erwinia sp. JH02]
MSMIEQLTVKYPGAIAWAFGDSPEMADELAELVIKGVKTATCGSLSSFKNEEGAPTIGGYSIILNGRDEPVCVIRTISLCIVRFCDVDEDLVRKEGEGDLSLKYWRTEHKAFFSREGTYQEDMELVAEEFERVEVL